MDHDAYVVGRQVNKDLAIEDYTLLSAAPVLYCHALKYSEKLGGLQCTSKFRFLLHGPKTRNLRLVIRLALYHRTLEHRRFTIKSCGVNASKD